MKEDIRKMLMAFSESANRTVSHPLDRQRWDRFVIAVHEARLEGVGSEVSRILMDDKWSPEDAENLVIDLEKGMDLLKEYDRHIR